MKKKLVQDTTAHFRKVFRGEPQCIVLSPGRINIIGEHVDYNDGSVLPAAINRYICFAVSPSGSPQCTLVAKDLNDAYKFDIGGQIRPVGKMWANYMLGVLAQLDGVTGGFNVVFSSTIPMGAGLSSSAALECGFGFALDQMFSLGLTRENIARIGQKAEHTFAGVNCGIMDQAASVFGRKDKVIRLDCTTLEHDYHNADFQDYRLMLIDSHLKHTHLTSGYNDRRRDVEEGLAILRRRFPEIKTFRDCTMQHLDATQAELGALIHKRCRYIVGEIARVNQAVEAMDKNDFATLGQLMYRTHEGLSVDYEVSCPEIDFLVHFARKDGVLGSRMMGGGFGGCSINLIRKEAEDDFVARITPAYREAFGIELKTYRVKISDGTNLYKKKLAS